jgi:hypothetical protein
VSNAEAAGLSYGGPQAQNVFLAGNQAASAQSGYGGPTDIRSAAGLASQAQDSYGSPSGNAAFSPAANLGNYNNNEDVLPTSNRSPDNYQSQAAAAPAAGADQLASAIAAEAGYTGSARVGKSLVEEPTSTEESEETKAENTSSSSTSTTSTTTSTTARSTSVKPKSKSTSATTTAATTPKN